MPVEHSVADDYPGIGDPDGIIKLPSRIRRQVGVEIPHHTTGVQEHRRAGGRLRDTYNLATVVNAGRSACRTPERSQVLHPRRAVERVQECAVE